MEGEDEMKTVILLCLALVTIFSLFGCVEKSNETMEKEEVQEEKEVEPQPTVNTTELNEENPEEEYMELDNDEDVFKTIGEVLENL